MVAEKEAIHEGAQCRSLRGRSGHCSSWDDIAPPAAWRIGWCGIWRDARHSPTVIRHVGPSRILPSEPLTMMTIGHNLSEAGLANKMEGVA